MCPRSRRRRRSCWIAVAWATLGLDTAVHVIDKGISLADSRLREWLTALGQLPEGPKVELAKLREAIPGIDDPDSEFYAYLELADLAIALKHRVLVLQAVEHAQHDEDNPFENFVDALKSDQRSLNQLVGDHSEFLQRLSTLRLDRSHGIMDFTIGAETSTSSEHHCTTARAPRPDAFHPVPQRRRDRDCPKKPTARSSSSWPTPSGNGRSRVADFVPRIGCHDIGSRDEVLTREGGTKVTFRWWVLPAVGAVACGYRTSDRVEVCDGAAHHDAAVPGPSNCMTNSSATPRR